MNPYTLLLNFLLVSFFVGLSFKLNKKRTTDFLLFKTKGMRLFSVVFCCYILLGLSNLVYGIYLLLNQ